MTRNLEAWDFEARENGSARGDEDGGDWSDANDKPEAEREVWSKNPGPLDDDGPEGPPGPPAEPEDEEGGADAAVLRSFRRFRREAAEEDGDPRSRSEGEEVAFPELLSGLRREARDDVRDDTEARDSDRNSDREGLLTSPLSPS